MLTKTQITKIKVDTLKSDDQFLLMFEALGDQGRFRISRLLMEYHDLCVTDIANVFGITTSAASQQLKILERVGLVRRIRMGQMVCYEIKEENPVVKKLIQFLRSSE